MDKVLQGIQMESPIRNSKGDYGKENFDTIVKKSPLVEVKNWFLTAQNLSIS